MARRRHRRRAWGSTNNSASHENDEKIHAWVSGVSFLYEYGAPLSGPPEFHDNRKLF